MSRQWLTLVAILLVYLPVAIDATVLHVAAPTLSMSLGTSSNALLWIIYIYSLVMAGMVLPMGALGDKIGFKRLLLRKDFCGLFSFPYFPRMPRFQVSTRLKDNDSFSHFCSAYCPRMNINQSKRIKM